MACALALHLVVCTWRVGSPQDEVAAVIWRSPTVQNRVVFLAARGAAGPNEPGAARFGLLIGCVVPLALLLAGLLVATGGRRSGRERLRDPALMLAVRERDGSKSRAAGRRQS